MFLHRRGVSRPIRASFLVIVTCLLSIYMHVKGREPHMVDRGVYAVTQPLHRVVSDAGRGLRALWLDYLSLVDIRAENKRLEAALRLSRVRGAQLETLVAENTRLRGLLELAEGRKDLRLKALRVTGRSNSHLFRVAALTIEGGDELGIEVGMPVISEGGLVGRITSSDDDQAEVMLLTDPRSAVDIMLERSKARGVLVGMGQSERYSAQLQYLDREARVADGELVLTTGDDERFPRGLPVGRIVLGQSPTTGPFRQAYVIPEVAYGRLEEVFVILGRTGLNASGSRFETGRRTR